MFRLHLAYNVSQYGARSLPVSPLSYGLRVAGATAVRLSYDFTGSVESTIL